MKKLLATSLALLTITITFSQTPFSPNLTIGAGEVLYEKGKIDAEVLGELIATKQDEVKTQLVQNLLERKLDKSNIVFRYFVKQNLELLFHNADPAIKKKELLTNSAELAMIIGIAEYYLVDLKKRTTSFFKEPKNYLLNDIGSDKIVTQAEIDFLLEYMRNVDSGSRKMLFSKFFDTFSPKLGEFQILKTEISTHQSAMKDKSDSERYVQDQMFYDTLQISRKIYMSMSYYRIKGFSKYSPNLFDQNFLESKDRKVEDRRPEHMQAKFTDETFTKVFENPNTVTSQSGLYLTKVSLLPSLMNTESFAAEKKTKSTFVSPHHLYIDMVHKVVTANAKMKQFGFYQRLDEDDALISQYEKVKTDSTSTITKYFKPMEEVLNTNVDDLLGYYVMIQRISDAAIDKDIRALFNQGKKISDFGEVSKAVAELNKVLRNPISNLTLSDEQSKTLKRLTESLHDISKEIKNVNDFANFFDTEIIPSLITYNFQDQAFTEILKNADTLNSRLKAFGWYTTINELTGISDYDQNKINSMVLKYKPYINLLQHLSNLDQAVTYDKIFKFLGDMGDLSSGTEAKRIINSFVNFYDKYTLIDEEKNNVSVDLGGITSDLYERYQANASSRVGFMFTIGLNTATPWFDKDQINFLTDTLGNTASNASFFSEKIGLRWNVVDFSKQYMRGSRAHKPLINNLHTVVYVSGLLYQINALNSVDGFNTSTLGVGVGATFFNNLDLNFSYAAKIDNFENDNYFNIGFDVQITEYLNALSKARAKAKANKN